MTPNADLPSRIADINTFLIILRHQTKSRAMRVKAQQSLVDRSSWNSLRKSPSSCSDFTFLLKVLCACEKLAPPNSRSCRKPEENRAYQILLVDQLVATVRAAMQMSLANIWLECNLRRWRRHATRTERSLRRGRCSTHDIAGRVLRPWLQREQQQARVSLQNPHSREVRTWRCLSALSCWVLASSARINRVCGRRWAFNYIDWQRAAQHTNCVLSADASSDSRMARYCLGDAGQIERRHHIHRGLHWKCCLAPVERIDFVLQRRDERRHHVRVAQRRTALHQLIQLLIIKRVVAAGAGRRARRCLLNALEGPG